MIENIGIISTVFILVSMLFKTTSVKGSLWMRALNILGSILFVVYGILLPALSTAILNAALIIVNTYHLIMLIKEYKKMPTKEEPTKEKTTKTQEKKQSTKQK